MSHIIQCRVCKVRFDISDLEEGIGYIHPTSKTYYHTQCYETWIKDRTNPQTKHDNEFWYECLSDYLYREVQIPVDWQKLKSQWKHYTAPTSKYTAKGIYFAMRYFYDYQDGKKSTLATKNRAGIGIIPYIYNDARIYWEQREQQRAGTIEAIIQETQRRLARPKQNIIRTTFSENKQPKWDLNNL